MLTIKEVLNSTAFGGTAPVYIIASDNNCYILKFRMSDEGLDIQNFNEFIGYQLSEKLNLDISPQKMKVIELNDTGLDLLEEAFRATRITFESIRYARQSLGPNICIERLEKVEKSYKVKNETFLSKMRLVDNILMNRDRYKENPNILKNLNKERYYCIDYGLSFLECRVYEKIVDNTIDRHLLGLYSCDALKYRMYLYKGSMYKAKLEVKCFEDTIIEIIDSMPKIWEPLKYRDIIIDLLIGRFAQKLDNNDECPVELY